MLYEIYMGAAQLVFLVCLITVSAGYFFSGMVYPNAAAPFLPDGPVRTIVLADLVIMGLLYGYRLVLA